MLKKIKILVFYILLALPIGMVYGQEVVENIEFFGNENIDDDQIQTWSGIKEGSAVNQTIISTTNKKIITGYQEAGYLFCPYRFNHY